MYNANVDLIQGNQARGEVARSFLANKKLDVGAKRPWVKFNDYGMPTGAYVTVYTGGDPKEWSSYKNIQVNAGTLRRDEWKALDAAVVRIAESRITGVQDLKNKGLVYPLGNAMGTTVLEWHDSSDAMEAQITMDGKSRGQNDRVVFNYNYLPIPIIHVDYEINERVLENSRRMGNPLTTFSAERAARRVNEKIEELFFTSTSYSFGESDSRSRNTIYSYLSHPDRNQVTLNDYGGGWDHESACTASDIIESVRAMKQASLDVHHFGPWYLYVPSEYETRLDDDYDTSGASTQTIRDRILKIQGIEAVKVNDTLTADNILLVEMNPETVMLVEGMAMTNVQWKTGDELTNNFKVMAIQVPWIRSDQDGNTGLVHMS